MPPLRADDFEALKKALLDAFSSEAALAPVVRRASGGRSVEQVGTGADLGETVEKLIRRAADEAWVPTLLEEAVKERPQHEALARLRDDWRVGTRFGGPGGVGTNHYKALILPGKMVLIGRQPLRDAVRALDTGQVRVLVVDGDAETGKTYSLQYISYVAEALRTFRFAPVDLERVPKNAANKVDAFGLGAAIGDALVGMPAPAPPADLNLTTWIEQYCNELGRALPGDAVRWLILDSFHKVTSEQSAYDLIAALAMRAYLDLGTLRVVLLSYRDHEWLKARVVGAVEYEQIASIGHVELIHFFSQLYTERTQVNDRPVDQAALVPEVIASVKRVLDSVPANGPRRLEALGRTTWVEVDRVVRPPAPARDPADELADEVLRQSRAGGTAVAPDVGT